MTSLSLKGVTITDIINENKELLSVKEILNVTNYEINELYVDKFWNNIENNKWILLDNETINWFEYKDLSNGKESIMKLLKKHHEINEDYKILNNTEYIILINDNNLCSAFEAEQNINDEINNNKENRGGTNKTYIIMNADCFKNICMLVKTKKSKEIRMYYIKLENIFKFYLEYQNQYQKKILEDKEKELLNKQLELEITKDKIMDMVRDFQHKELEMDEYIYIATNLFYHKQKVYKIGKSSKLNKREKAFNTFFINGQKMHFIFIFQCHNSRILEQLLFTCLSNYQYNKVNELFNIDINKLYKIVLNVCCAYNAIINFSNKELFDINIDNILLNEMPSGQTYPINHKNVNLEKYDELLLKKYVNNKNISNVIIKDFKEYDFEDHILVNNKALAYDSRSKFYYLIYYEKMLYVCTNCGILKKDKRGYEQHINKRNKCTTVKLNYNTIENIEIELKNQNITLYKCETCDIVFKTRDHYKRHLDINCKNAN